VRSSFGFDDPAETGAIYGYLSPLLVLAETSGLNVECRPEFLEAGIQGRARATVEVRPMSILGALVAFVVSPAALRAAIAGWRARTSAGRDQ
jgi:hypothetical protein